VIAQVDCRVLSLVSSTQAMSKLSRQRTLSDPEFSLDREHDLTATNPINCLFHDFIAVYKVRSSRE